MRDPEPWRKYPKSVDIVMQEFGWFPCGCSKVFQGSFKTRWYWFFSIIMLCVISDRYSPWQHTSIYVFSSYCSIISLGSHANWMHDERHMRHVLNLDYFNLEAQIGWLVLGTIDREQFGVPVWRNNNNKKIIIRFSFGCLQTITFLKMGFTNPEIFEHFSHCDFCCSGCCIEVSW